MSLHVTRRLSLVVRPSHAMSGQLEVRMTSIIQYIQYLCDTYAWYLQYPCNIYVWFLQVKCNANIGEAYWQTASATVAVLAKPSYMLESRSSSNSGQNMSALKLNLEVLIQPYIANAHNPTPYLLFCWSIPAIHFSHSIYCLSFQNWGIFISPPPSLYCVKWFCVSKKTPAGSILHTHTAAAEERMRQHFISSPFTFHTMPESHNKAEDSTSNVYRYPHQAIFRIFSKKNDFHDSPHCPELNDKLLEASPECDILNLALRNNSP